MKQKLGAVIPSYPMPVALVGARVHGKPNFLAVAWFSMVSYKPPMIAVVLGAHHYTNKGIKESKAFSVCIPSEKMVQITDYVGICSGEKIDKSDLFELFDGETNAPLIKDCPVAIECVLEKIEVNGQNELFVGTIVHVYAEEAVLTNGRIDLQKVKPFMLSQGDTLYYSLGEKLASAWSIGKQFKKS